MALNDRLKSDYFRAPMTKLALRSQVVAKLNDLIDFYNNLATLINNTYDKIDTSRTIMLNILNQIYAKTIHFKYILEHFEIQVDEHASSKLQNLMDTFSNQISNLVQAYATNLFDHNAQSDASILTDSIDDQTNLNDWTRQVEALPTELGIRWFGGKLSDKFVVNKLNNVLHVIKANTRDGNLNEDYINTGLILELFIFTKRGFSWFVLGQDGNYGYNFINKYQSDSNNISGKFMSRHYFSPKRYSINKFDVDFILHTMLTQDDIDRGSVYIKVKTNIPSNSESGRSSYFLTCTDDIANFTNKKQVENAAHKALWVDNKDVEYTGQTGKSLDEILQEHITDTEPTANLMNATFVKGSNNSTEKELGWSIFSDLTIEQLTNGKRKVVIKDNNSENGIYGAIRPKVDGRVFAPTSYVGVNDEYLDEINVKNTPFETDLVANYNDKALIVDLFDHRNVGKVNPILVNENMFEIDSSVGGKTTVIPNDSKYGDSKEEEIIPVKLTNNAVFGAAITTDESKFTEISVTNASSSTNGDFTINDIISTPYGIFAATNTGVLLFKNGITLIEGATVDHKIYKMFNLKDSTIYAIGEGGVYYYDPSQMKFILCNIRTKRIAGIAYDANNDFLMVIANDIDFSALNRDTEGNVHLENFMFGAKMPSGATTFADYYSHTNGVPVNATLFANETEASEFCAPDGEFKIVHSPIDGAWYILNTASKKLFKSVSDNLYSFAKDYTIHGKVVSVTDIYAYNDTIYVSVVDSNDKTFIATYQNGELTPVCKEETVIKNTREVTKENFNLDEIISPEEAA